jgi:hypothetical protein
MKNIRITMTDEQATELYWSITRDMIRAKKEQELKGENYNVLEGTYESLKELRNLIPDSCQGI